MKEAKEIKSYNKNTESRVERATKTRKEFLKKLKENAARLGLGIHRDGDLLEDASACLVRGEVRRAAGVSLTDRSAVVCFGGEEQIKYHSNRKHYFPIASNWRV